jgi:hypothetical protein
VIWKCHQKPQSLNYENAQEVLFRGLRRPLLRRGRTRLRLDCANILTARALHSKLRARARFRDALDGTLHGVTSESGRRSRWRAVPVERVPPILSGEVVDRADLPAQTVSSTDTSMLLRQNRETTMRCSSGMLKSNGFLAGAIDCLPETALAVGVD